MAGVKGNRNFLFGFIPNPSQLISWWVLWASSVFKNSLDQDPGAFPGFEQLVLFSRDLKRFYADFLEKHSVQSETQR